MYTVTNNNIIYHRTVTKASFSLSINSLPFFYLLKWYPQHLGGGGSMNESKTIGKLFYLLK